MSRSNPVYYNVEIITASPSVQIIVMFDQIMQGHGEKLTPAERFAAVDWLCCAYGSDHQKPPRTPQ